jgi:hypothetical protein
MDQDEPAFEFPFSDDEPAFDDFAASAEGHEAEQADFESGAMEETTLEDSREGADEGAGGDEDDFDAWLAKSVVVM